MISSLTPTRGLHTGGVLITLSGRGFRTVPQGDVTKSPLLCGFGLRGALPYPPANTTSVATLDKAGRLRCTSPWREMSGGYDEVGVALNGPNPTPDC